MQPDPNPNIIEELKAAGEELKKGERESKKIKEIEKENLKSRKSQPEKRSQTLSDTSLIAPVAERKGWVLLENYQKVIAGEKQRLRKAYQRIEVLEKKVRERLEMIEKMTVDTERINKELKEISQKIVSIKKEDNTLLLQIKDLVGEDNPDQEKNEH